MRTSSTLTPFTWARCTSTTRVSYNTYRSRLRRRWTASRGTRSPRVPAPVAVNATALRVARHVPSALSTLKGRTSASTASGVRSNGPLLEHHPTSARPWTRSCRWPRIQDAILPQTRSSASSSPPSPWTREVNYRRPRRKNNKTYPKIFSHGAQEREVYQAMAKVKVATKIVLELLNTGLYHVLFCKLRYHCCQIVVRWINHVKYCFRFPKLWRKMLTPLFGETGMSRFFCFVFFFLRGGGGGGGGGMHWHPVTSLLEL